MPLDSGRYWVQRWVPSWCRQERNEKRLHAQYHVAAQRTSRIKRVTSSEYVTSM